MEPIHIHVCGAVRRLEARGIPRRAVLWRVQDGANQPGLVLRLYHGDVCAGEAMLPGLLASVQRHGWLLKAAIAWLRHSLMAPIVQRSQTPTPPADAATTLLWFGPAQWGAELCAGPRLWPAPVRESCYWCGEPFTAGDRGVARRHPMLRPLPDVDDLYHADCFQRRAYGPAAKINGDVQGEDRPGLSRRQAALEAAEALHRATLPLAQAAHWGR